MDKEISYAADAIADGNAIFGVGCFLRDKKGVFMAVARTAEDLKKRYPSFDDSLFKRVAVFEDDDVTLKDDQND